ncbi:TrkH family potassium uptake protein [Frigoribacterium sp. ACAM 257]|uniref:TrkH family potassium uptake protein n=1 Tax=Frigoribacterium sp. ACAM 257 TaxID=2508998 RepID=UPI0011B9C5AC|nr:potassium transporter TrkG [Frigoribacterium sp. ACAM 257]TWX40099.1 TrkH family potassium uptake protein [Frigoribacterium sp. ACAM 257]
MTAVTRASVAPRRGPSPAPTSVFQRLSDWVDDIGRKSPARFAILIFTGLILVFTVVFSLPVASADRTVTPLADSLFTAVSVICVTGLATVDMATHWSLFGHVVIFVGVQIGAIGVLTLASIMGLVVSRKLGLRARLMAAGDSNPLRAHAGPVPEGQAVRLGEIGGLLTTVALSSFVIQLVIALLMIPRMLIDGIPLGDAVLDSFYYSAMAFTNTGFTPNADGLAAFENDYWFLSLIMVGVFLGSIGFPVIYALARNPRNPRRWSVHVKLTLLTTAILIVFGMVLYIVLEFDNPETFGDIEAGPTVFQSLFLSMMTRSGGFSTIQISDLNGSSLLVTDMLMFIGGGSASTAGGIKVTTLAVLFLAAFAEARGQRSMEAFGRRIPSDVLRLAVSVVLWGATIVAVSSILIMHITKEPLDHVLFECISAFATSGLSTGLTDRLPDSAKYILAVTMWMGRVGTVTLSVALAASQRRQLFTRAEERPIVG